MNWLKFWGVLWIIVAVATIAPIPLSFVDLTFHWLLIVTIPFGGALLVIIGIIWLVKKSKKIDQNLEKES